VVSKAFPADDLEELTCFGSSGELVRVEDEIVGERRWSIERRMVFSHDGHYWAVNYETPATEMQDIEPFDDDLVECVEVYPREKITIVYEEVK
jgi:hypothetical protein